MVLSAGVIEARGLGARHQAAAAITAVTNSVAVRVSQSTGTVTIFRRGAIVTEIEEPRRREQGKPLQLEGGQVDRGD